VTSSIIVEIGEVPVRLSASEPDFLGMMERRYSGFIVSTPSRRPFELTVSVAPGQVSSVEDVQVSRHGTVWRFERGDFSAEWSPESGNGSIRQARMNPYSIDAVLRILHSVLLAPEGGLLLHAASAIRHGRAYVFSGVSGAGKTTISRLAPPDATLLTDEISYIRPAGDSYRAFGTPFTGELAKVGENAAAPLDTVFLLSHGPENRLTPLAATDAARALLRNVLFFAQDPELVQMVFQSVCQLVARVPVRSLAFTPEPAVWEMIR